MFRSFIIFILLFHFSTSFADISEIPYYFKGTIGAHKMNPAKETNSNLDFNLKQDSLLSPHLNLGIGRYCTDIIRVDATYHYHFPYFETEARNFSSYDDTDGSIITGGVSVKRKAYIQSLMLNGYVDVLDKKNYKIFMGAGVGIAQIKEKINFIMSGNIVAPTGEVFTFLSNASPQTTKKAYNFSYSFTMGSSIKIQSNMHLDASYSWHDFGKTKPRKVTNEESATKNRYAAHHVSIGIRFDL